MTTTEPNPADGPAPYSGPEERAARERGAVDLGSSDRVETGANLAIDDVHLDRLSGADDLADGEVVGRNPVRGFVRAMRDYAPQVYSGGEVHPPPRSPPSAPRARALPPW